METDEVFINLFQRDKSSINIDSISIEGNLPIEAKLLKNDNQVCTISVKNNIINDASFENGRTANIVIHTQRGDYLTVPVVCNKQFD
jgi:hypothetical protein